MTLPASGPISLAQIAAEFGGVAPHSLSEYYKGGAYVSATDTAPNVPTSGPISLSNFYGAAKNIVGQQAWTTAGTFSFVVPAGVTSICAVGIGSGASGATGAAGDTSTSGAAGGGATTYLNGIPVTPGETLTIVIGAPGGLVNVDNSDGNNGAAVQILRGATVLLNANGGLKGLATQVGGNGGAASAPAGGVSWAGGKGANGTTSTVAYGGTSGKYTSAGSQGGSGNPGGGLNLCATLFGANTGSNIGRGGNGVRARPSEAGYVGGVRIIWGAGRSFPSAAADV